MIRLLIYIILTCALVSCGPGSVKKSINEYYDINGLIDRQVALLDSISPILYKKALIDGQTETSQLSSNDSIWSRELQIFRSVDINKPMLAGRYIKTKKTIDGSKSIIFKSLEPKKTDVDSLVVNYLSEENNPSRIWAVIRNNNALYRNEKKLEMVFDPQNGTLTSFKIKGWQKMIARDSSSYLLEGLLKKP